ncbi:MAG: Arginyl-tRNA synthetase [Candidatus Carbobacillus altaicus]|uniref:Arginine--tRNA ligase n=1 Tax=Candidatus Carbonibacillus altaicus TaxID=2163959 RepID=A0A2R6Y1J6_9BACL|nr:MAG: Arginyl-tRNA synthetase [Candidatus Carbobacillus altaicus]
MLKQYVAEHFEPYIPEWHAADILNVLEIPPDTQLGDFALPVFTLAKLRRKAPPLIARELAEAIGDHSHIKVQAVGGYVNVFLNRKEALRAFLEHWQTVRARYAEPTGKGERVIIDMSSPNIAKPFGVGHLRSTVIGQAIYNLYVKHGYEALRVNHIGDWGTQFGKQIAAYKRWGQDLDLDRATVKDFLDLYVRFHEEAEHDPALEHEGRAWFQKLESGDLEATRLWKIFVERSLKEFDRMYARLGVSFDAVLGESFYNDKMDAVIAQLKEKGLLEESEGAHVVRLDDEGLPPCIILKSDGTTIYATRDLATAMYRHDVMGGDWLIYVVGQEQTLHFRQIIAVLKKMGYDWADRMVHTPFGLLRFAGKKLSTRRGHVIFLEDVLDEAVARARAIIEEKNPALEDKEAVAEAVGIGAIIFNDLKNSRLHDVNFSLEEALNFDGETGPYVQYTHARVRTVLARMTDEDRNVLEEALPRARSDQDSPYLYTLSTDPAWALIKSLDRYPEVLQEALIRHEPSVVARYVLDLAKEANRFYHQERILVQDAALRLPRLYLMQEVAKVLADGLDLLGIPHPEQI